MKQHKGVCKFQYGLFYVYETMEQSFDGNERQTSPVVEYAIFDLDMHPVGKKFKNYCDVKTEVKRLSAGHHESGRLLAA